MRFADDLARFMREETDRRFPVLRRERVLGGDETVTDTIKPQATVRIDERFHHVRRVKRFGDRWSERTR